MVSHDERPDTSIALAQRLRAGDHAAWAEVEAEYRAALLRFADGYLGDPIAAEDAVQETFMRALRADSTPDSVRPWLYRIARNHCLNVLRNGRVRGEQHLPSAAPFMRSTAGHLTRLVAAEDVAVLRGTLERLSIEHREVLELRYGEDLSRAEIAEVLDLSPSVVKSRLFEATKKLRALAGE